MDKKQLANLLAELCYYVAELEKDPNNKILKHKCKEISAKVKPDLEHWKKQSEEA